SFPTRRSSDLGNSAVALYDALLAQGAVPRFVAPRIGAVKTSDGSAIRADASLENEPGFLFDALALADGADAVAALAADGHTTEFIKDQFRHCKTILALGASISLLDDAAIPMKLPSGKDDPGLFVGAASPVMMKAFIAAIGRHRHPERETDPPAV